MKTDRSKTKRKRTSLLEPRRLYGRWHLAGDNNETIPGFWEVSKRGAQTLTLMGALTNRHQNSAQTASARGRIVGNLENGNVATLEGCVVSFTTLIANPPRQIWQVSEAVLGGVFDATEPWAFFGMMYSLPGLTNWVPEAASERHVDIEQGQFGATLRAQKWPLWNHEGVSVQLVSQVSSNVIGEADIRLGLSVLLHVSANRPLVEQEAHVLALRPLRALIGLSSGAHTAATTGSVQLQAGDQFIERIWQPIDTGADVERPTYAFNFADVRALDGDPLQRWLARSIRLEVVLDLYLASLRRTEGVLAEQTFLLVAQAVEVYQREIDDAAGLLDTEPWKALHETLRSCVKGSGGDTEVRKILYSKLRGLNQKTLRQRLEQLLVPLGASASAVCSCDTASFAAVIAATRNRLTHWGDDKAELAITDGAGLVYARFRLLAILELHLLREIGFAADSAPWKEVLRRRVSWLPSFPTPPIG